MTRSRDARLAVALGALALLVRVVFVLVTQRGGFPPGDLPPEVIAARLNADGLLNDAFFYHRTAELLASGEGFSSNPGVPTAQWPPVFPALLSIVYRVTGPEPVAGELMNCLAGALTVPLLYLLALRTFGRRREAVIAAGALAVFPGQVLWTDVLLSETVYALSLVGFFCLVCLLPQRRWTPVALGAAVGLCVLTRGEGLLLLPALLAVWWPGLPRRRALALAGAATLVALLVVAPWSARNTLAMDAFVPLSTNSSTTLWSGHNPAATGAQVYAGRALLGQIPQSGKAREVEEGKLLRREALDFMVHNPRREAELVPLKLAYLNRGDSKVLEWVNGGRGSVRPVARDLVVPVGVVADFAYYALLATTVLSILVLGRELWRNPVTRGVLVLFAGMLVVYRLRVLRQLPLPRAAGAADAPGLRAAGGPGVGPARPADRRRVMRWRVALALLFVAGLAIRIAYGLSLDEPSGDAAFYHEVANRIARRRRVHQPLPRLAHRRPPAAVPAAAVAGLARRGHEPRGPSGGGLRAGRGDGGGRGPGGSPAGRPPRRAGRRRARRRLPAAGGQRLPAAQRVRLRPGGGHGAPGRPVGARAGRARARRSRWERRSAWPRCAAPRRCCSLCSSRRCCGAARPSAAARSRSWPWPRRWWCSRGRHATCSPSTGSVLVSTNDGSVFAGANCPSAYGPLVGGWDLRCSLPAGVDPRRSRAESRALDQALRSGRVDDPVLRRALSGRNEAVVAERQRDEGLDYARDHAGRVPAVVAARVGRTWSLYRQGEQVRTNRFLRGSPAWLEWLTVIGFFAAAALAVAGAYLLRARRAELLVLLTPVVLVTFASALGYGTPRFRQAAEVAIVILAGVALARLFSRSATGGLS